MARKGTRVVKWDEKMAQYAENAAAGEVGTGGNWLSLAGGVLSYQGKEIPDNTLRVVILDSIHENIFFETNYDPNNPATPACYAFGRKEPGVELQMAPHEEAVNKQADLCEDCPNFEWGSADKGKGKACRETRRLSIILADGLDSADAVREAEEAYLKLPVTSVKGWSGYVSAVTDLKRPPFAVITELEVVPDKKNQFKVLFRLHEQITDADLFEALIERHEAAKEKIMFPYAVMDDDEPAPQARKKKTARKAANNTRRPARKKTARKY